MTSWWAIYLPSEPADFGNPVVFVAGPGDCARGVAMSRMIDSFSTQYEVLIPKLPEGPSAAVFCLVLRSTLSGPWDHAGAGAGVPGLWGTRGKSSGELADANE